MNPAYFVWAGIALYVPIFYILCWRRPDRAMFLIFASAPFQNEVSGPLPVKFSMAEVNLLLSLPMMLVRAKKLYFGATFPASALYLAIGLGFTIPQWRPTSLVSLVQIGVYLFAAVTLFASLPNRLREYLPALKGLVWVGGFLTLMMFAKGESEVFGLNKNGLGSSLGATLLVAIELFSAAEGRREKWIYGGLLALIATGILYTLSRGAWVGAIAGVVTIFVLRRQFKRLVKTTVMLAPLLAIGWILLPQESRDYATGFGQERFNIKLRYESAEFALAQFKSSPWMGVGVGLRKEYDATNLALMTLAETGVPGLCALLLIHAVVAGMILIALRRLPKESLEYSLLVIAGALAMDKLMHGMVDHYWSRGSLMAAWAAVGMATRVVAIQRAGRNQHPRMALPYHKVAAEYGQPCPQN